MKQLVAPNVTPNTAASLKSSSNELEQLYGNCQYWMDDWPNRYRQSPLPVTVQQMIASRKPKSVCWMKIVVDF